MKRISTLYAVLLVVSSVALGAEDSQPAMSEGTVKPAWLEPRHAEDIASKIEPIRINLRYPKDQSQVVEYSNGRWRYIVSVAVPRGRSSIHAGIILHDGIYVRGTKPEKIMTPFGLMQYLPPKSGYRQGWWPAKDDEETPAGRNSDAP